MTADIQRTQVRITTDDGVQLTAYQYGSIGQPVLLAGGLAISQGYYKAFAVWLAARGYVVLTFDLRGMNESRAPQGLQSIHQVRADFLIWARQDFAACVRHLCRVTQASQITVIGHSLGMQHILWVDDSTRALIKHCIAIASGTGYWRDWAPPSRRFAPILFYVLMPVLTRLLGFFPGRRLGMVGDLPRGVAMQWIKWCRHPKFALGVEEGALRVHCQSMRIPVQAFAFSDDEAITETCVRQQLALTPHAPQRMTVLTPQQFGMKKIGHVGAFSRQVPEALWTVLMADMMK